MFNIISGLGHGAVSRLKQTWEKLPGKYQRLFRDMQDLMDPSRNMSKYRNLINSEHVQPPMVKLVPFKKKKNYRIRTAVFWACGFLPSVFI
jgi:Rap guanine nucleotide exchange factor 2